MKKKYYFGICIGFILASVCLFSFSKELKEEIKWKEKMGHFAGIITGLLGDIAQQEKNQSKERAKRIEQNAIKLSEMAHKVKVEEMPDADPSLEFVSTLFSDEMKQGIQALSSGNPQYAYRIFKGATKYCVACHTRMEKNSLQFGDLSKVTQGLTAFEKAEILGALHQFDVSYETYKKIVSDESQAKSAHVEWERALKRALTLAIRVKDDPQWAMDVIAVAEKNKNIPVEYKDVFVEWKKSIRQWEVDRAKKDLTAQDYFNHGAKLFKQGELKKDYFFDPKSFIDLLRASSCFHKSLKLKKSEGLNFQPEALYSLGFIYETLGDLELWNLHELYYETCISRFSHTPWSEKCYLKYADSVIAGYSGTAGTQLPPEVKSKLEKFKKLSVIREASKK